MRRSYCLRDTLIWTLIIYFIFIAAVFLFNIIFSDVIRHSQSLYMFQKPALSAIYGLQDYPEWGIEIVSDPYKICNIRIVLTVFVAAYRLLRDMKLICQILLPHPVHLSQFFKFYRIHDFASNTHLMNKFQRIIHKLRMSQTE